MAGRMTAPLARTRARRPRLATLADVMAPPREDKVQAAIIAYVEAAYPQVDIFHIPNGANLSKAERGKMKRQGRRRGILDLYLVWDGGDGWLEVKRPGFSPSDVSTEQRRFIERQRTNRRNVGIVASIDDVADYLIRWRAPKGPAL